MTTDRADALTLDQWHALSDAERDALVIERVYGWRRGDEEKFETSSAWYKDGEPIALVHFYADPSRRGVAPTTSNADACAVLDRMVKLGWSPSLCHTDGLWEACFDRPKQGVEKPHKYDPEAHYHEATTRPAAICLAAARAVGAVQ